MQKQKQTLKCSTPRGEMKPATTAAIRRSLPLSFAPEQRQKALTPPGRGCWPSCCTASWGVLVCTNPIFPLGQEVNSPK